MPVQIGNPLRILHIRLPTRNRLDVVRVHQSHVKVCFKDIPDRLPIRARALHRYIGNFLLREPIRQRSESQSDSARIASVVVPNVRVSDPSGMLIWATTVFLWISNPPHRAGTTSIGLCLPALRGLFPDPITRILICVLTLRPQQYVVPRACQAKLINGLSRTIECRPFAERTLRLRHPSPFSSFVAPQRSGAWGTNQLHLVTSQVGIAIRRRRWDRLGPLARDHRTADRALRARRARCMICHIT